MARRPSHSRGRAPERARRDAQGAPLPVHPKFTLLTGSSGPLLEGVRVSANVATTHSLVMRARSGTVRFVEAHHDLERKTIHLRSTQAERRV